MTPTDLVGLDAESAVTLLFGESPPCAPWWTLVRADDKAFTWTDHRLGFSLRMTHGALVALSEVSTVALAKKYAERNKITLLSDGGIYFKNQSVAELFLICQGQFPPDELKTPKDLYRIGESPNFSVSVGYASYFFQRLVLAPASETDQSLPDPDTVTTLVLTDVSREEDISGRAELAVYFLRRRFPGMRFHFWPLPELPRAPDWEPIDELTAPASYNLTGDTRRHEIIAFYNRAVESGPLPGFLYFYRVLESCFDDVIDAAIQSWRCDSNMSAKALLKKILTIQKDREDRWALRQVLGALVDQKQLDDLAAQELMQPADCDTLREVIYQRRNSIVHGRPGGQYSQSLVPYGFSSGAQGVKDRAFYDLLKQLADKALSKWVLA